MSYGTYKYGSLGEIGGSQEDFSSYLKHSLMGRPLRSPVQRSQITSLSQGLDYAQAGFHVSVDRGLNERSGSNPRRAWAYAAKLYYDAVNGGYPKVVSNLKEADAAASAANSATRDMPPINPVPTQPVNTSDGAPPVPAQIPVMSAGFGGLPGPVINLPFIGPVPVLLPVGALALVLWSRRGGKGRRAQRRSHRSRVRAIRRSR